MVKAFMEDEETHLEAMVQFLITNEIADDLKAHGWAVVARVYNGLQYAKHNYDGRMAHSLSLCHRYRVVPPCFRGRNRFSSA